MLSCLRMWKTRRVKTSNSLLSRCWSWVTIRRRWNGKKSGKGKFNFLHIFSFHFVSFAHKLTTIESQLFRFLRPTLPLSRSRDIWVFFMLFYPSTRMFTDSKRKEFEQFVETLQQLAGERKIVIEMETSRNAVKMESTNLKFLWTQDDLMRLHCIPMNRLDWLPQRTDWVVESKKIHNAV